MLIDKTRKGDASETATKWSFGIRETGDLVAIWRRRLEMSESCDCEQSKCLPRNCKAYDTDEEREEQAGRQAARGQSRGSKWGW